MKVVDPWAQASLTPLSNTWSFICGSCITVITECNFSLLFANLTMSPHSTDKVVCSLTDKTKSKRSLYPFSVGNTRASLVILR